jgi:hypothetical protein
MRLIQYHDNDDRLGVARVVDHDQVRPLAFEGGTLALALAALRNGRSLQAEIERCDEEAAADYAALVRDGRLAPPLSHPDPAHCLVSGTGLTHLGSADTRHAMHERAQPATTGEQSAPDESLSDSIKMFQMGVADGRPEAGRVGAQPEWFYKGDGDSVAAPGQPLTSPAFAEDAGEEPEIVGLYVIGDDRRPYRLGFALGNELSDHVVERGNYLWLAHSKLRACSVGPELRFGDLPAHLVGHSRIRRDGALLWQQAFATGEANMSHSIANLEHHHFKYAAFRRPGDVHLHFMGTATLSFADGVATRDGDIFEIGIDAFGRPLHNPLQTLPAEPPSPAQSL